MLVRKIWHGIVEILIVTKIFMESYLKGRGFKNPVETENVSFQGYLDGQKESQPIALELHHMPVTDQ